MVQTNEDEEVHCQLYCNWPVVTSNWTRNVVLLQSDHIRFLTMDVAIAQVYWHFSPFIDPWSNKMPAADCIATVVYVKEKSKWL